MNSQVIQQTVEDAMQPDEEVLHREPFAGWREGCLVIILCPLVWGLGAFLMHGGISYWILGIAVMRLTGARDRIVVVRCDRSSSGFLWHYSSVERYGFRQKCLVW